MRSRQVALAVCALALVGSVVASSSVFAAEELIDKYEGPVSVVPGPHGPAPLPPDPSATVEQRVSVMEEWKAKIENLPSLSDKFNVGMNALQFLYTHQNAHVAEGKSQDNFSIRRSELLFYGKINEYIPKWHALSEFQSIGLTNSTPDCSKSPGNDCSQKASGTAASATFFRESYIDFRPLPGIAPNLNMIRMGIFSYALRYFYGNVRWYP